MNAFGYVLLPVLILVIIAAPARWAVFAFLFTVLGFTEGQQVNVFGFNMFALRFLEIAGILRVTSRKEVSFRTLNPIDKSLIALLAYTTVVFVVRSKDDQVYQIGIAVDALLCYFTFRGLIRTIDDLDWMLGAFLILLIPFTAALLVESFTATNPLYSLNGTDLVVWSREGRPRCLGTFRNPSLLGTVGASFLPLYISHLLRRVNRAVAIPGILLCLIIVWSSNSGAPLNCVAICIVGWCLWPLREHMTLFRRGLVGFLLLMAVTMEAPIWYIPAKVSALTGGDGWHRSYLMDVAFRDLPKWWLLGMPITETQGWFPYELVTTGAADITNQFIAYGLAAGLVSMLLFIRLLVVAFKAVGASIRVIKTSTANVTNTDLLYWSFGVLLTVHIFNWLGITYFDQTYVLWFLQLATMSTLMETATNQSDEYQIPEEGVSPNGQQSAST